MPASFCDPGGLDHEVVPQTSAKTTPHRVMCTVTSAGETPSVVATSVAPGPGFCVGAQISTLPSLTCAVQFCGSMLICARNGYA